MPPLEERPRRHALYVEEEGLAIGEAGPPDILPFMYIFMPLHKESQPHTHTFSGSTKYLGALFFKQYFKSIMVGLQKHF